MAQQIETTPIMVVPVAAAYWQKHGQVGTLRVECEPEDVILFGPCPERVTYRDFRFTWVHPQCESITEEYLTWMSNGIRFAAPRKHIPNLEGGKFIVNQEGGITFYHPVAEENKGKYSFSRLPALPDTVYVMVNNCVHDVLVLGSTVNPDTGRSGVICANKESFVLALSRRYAEHSGSSYRVISFDTESLCNYIEKNRFDGVYYIDSEEGMKFHTIAAVPQE